MKSLFMGKLWLILSTIVFTLSHQAFSFDDHSFYSREFTSKRFYRIYLPAGYYKNTGKKYPVIYYFHGWGGRYKWDAYSISYDPYHKGKARKHPLFVDEWEDYVKTHDVIIVTWDGYEPKYQIGKHEREGIKYGSCQPYDYLRAHNVNRDVRGLDYSKYFQELVAHIDSTYRTIANRNNRAITGLSMGGLMAYYIAGQNKDLINSVSSFCPADNYPLFGNKGEQIVFPILEMHRSLKGVHVRLTMTDGDWLRHNDLAINQLWSSADLSHFEFHVAHFRDHFAADTEQQLNFHMKHFTDNHSIPKSWNYISPGFADFRVFGYEVIIKRDTPALTLMDKYADGKLKIMAREFLPDGPVIQNESISIKTDLPFLNYTVTAFNLSKRIFSHPIGKEMDGKLAFELDGGGAAVGVNGGTIGDSPHIFIIDKSNRDYQYCEFGKVHTIDLTIVNAGNTDAESIEITASSTHPAISFIGNKIKIDKLKKASFADNHHSVKFEFSDFHEAISAGNISFEIKVNGDVLDTQKILFIETPESPYVDCKDVILLDGRAVKNIPVFHQESNSVQNDTLSGGQGNGNGVLEKGEEALVYIKIDEGISCADVNTFHKAYLINADSDPYVKVNKLRYDEKIKQAGATSISSILSVSEKLPKSHIFDLWFRLESLYNNNRDQVAISPVYEFKYDYRRVKLEK